MDLVVMGVYVLEFVLKLIAAPHPVVFIKNINNIIDLITIVPLIIYI